MSKDFTTAIKDRRSYYGISKTPVISDDKIIDLVNQAVKYTPSSFNSQSARVLVLLNEQHDKFWDLTTETLRKIVPAESFDPTYEKMQAFRSGKGTVLFFEDQDIIKGLQNQFSAYADNFPLWSLQSSGMLQYVVWTSLENEGLGASLQHYNPLIDEHVQAEWNIPSTWKLIAQMPFGKPTVEAGEKTFQPLEERVKIAK